MIKYASIVEHVYIIYRTMFPTFYEKSCEQEIHGILRAPSLRVKLNETCEITLKGIYRAAIKKRVENIHR